MNFTNISKRKTKPLALTACTPFMGKALVYFGFSKAMKGWILFGLFIFYSKAAQKLSPFKWLLKSNYWANKQALGVGVEKCPK